MAYFINNLSYIHYFIFHLINNYTEVGCKPQYCIGIEIADLHYRLNIYFSI